MENHRSAKWLINLYVLPSCRTWGVFSPKACQDWKDFLYVAWSPLGTYVATLHRQGVRLWGGLSWQPQQRFAHPLVKLIDFSPCEQYLVTWSNEPIVVPERAVQGPQYFSPDDEGNNIAVWDIKSGDLLRTFSTQTDGELHSAKKQMQWPALKWSPDDKLVARITPGQMISVHELPSMFLHGKKSLKIEGVVDFEWCPLGDKDKEDSVTVNGSSAKSSKKVQENMLVYWTPEVANQPARVTLLAFPSRTILRQKNLFHVTEVRFSHWISAEFTHNCISSVNCFGKVKAISSVSKSTDTRRRKNPSFAIWKYSACGKKTIQWKSSNSKVR
jgi:translation initiation factor 3 subunit B